tara:strand:- start:284 stop:574 length:291 start_codon:yes stop_codon:yes gene_type:complete
MKKYFIAITVLLAINTAVSADDYYWFVKKLDGVKLSDSAKIGQIFKAVKKNDIVEAPIHWASLICQYDKSVLIFQDHIKRDVVSCAYVGKIRNSAE